jgi:uncharacterized protein YjbI with pentapeptide repeats
MMVSFCKQMGIDHILSVMANDITLEYDKAKRLILNAHKRFLELKPDGVLLDLEGENLRLAVFDGADLRRATFTKAVFQKADFTDCDFHLARFENARLTRVKMAGAVFSPTVRLLKPIT